MSDLARAAPGSIVGGNVERADPSGVDVVRKAAHAFVGQASGCGCGSEVPGQLADQTGDEPPNGRMRAGRGGRVPVLQRVALIAAASLVVFLAWRNEQRVYQDDGRLVVQVNARVATLTWAGAIDVPMARRLGEAYERLGPDVDGFVIDLHSQGGSVLEGRRVIGVLEDIARTHRLVTQVGSGRVCLSMCVPIFLAGAERRAAPDAIFMFHEPSSRDVLTGQAQRRPAFEQRHATARFVERYFLRSAMTPEWRAGLIAQWHGTDVWKTGAELVAERSGVVSVLTDQAGDASSE